MTYCWSCDYCHKTFKTGTVAREEKVIQKHQQTQQHLRNVVIGLVDKFFENRAKAEVWFVTSNPLLGGLSPKRMIVLGRGEKLVQFIYILLEEGSEAS